MSTRRKIFKACRRCRLLVDREVVECPNCGSRDFTDEWEGVIIVIDPGKSLVASKLNINKPGRYALKVT